MALAMMKSVLKDAQKNTYAVLACNLLSYEMLLGGIRAAEEANSPLILQLAPVQFDTTPLEHFGPIMVDLAKKASVPVVVHLDHGFDFEEIKQAIDFGFTSVMIDASSQSFEDNVTLTKKVVEYAHKHHVNAEAELGSVGAEGEPIEDIADASENLTDVTAAKKFVELTGCDALAVAIGNAHGLHKQAPALDFERLSDIRNAVDVPLVLHGGSGSSDDDFKQCIKRGITKINIASFIHKTYVDGMNDQDAKTYPGFHIKGIAIAKDTVNRFLHLFGSVNHA